MARNHSADVDTHGFILAEKELGRALEKGEDAGKWFKRNASCSHGKWTAKDLQMLYDYYYGVDV